MIKTSISSLLAGVALLAAGTSAADDGTGSYLYEWIQSMEQDGGDVIVSVKSNYAPIEVTLTREGNHDPVELFSGALDEGDADEHVGDCPTIGTEQTCIDHPESCWDCDGDGVNECLDICTQRYRFDFVDKCVYPSSVEYVLADDDDVNAEEFVVEDLGQDCPKPPGWGDESGCSTSGQSAGPGAPFALLMLAVGLFALVWRRRPRR
jgi:MYXO-CTERM domain-containing protein